MAFPWQSSPNVHKGARTHSSVLAALIVLVSFDRIDFCEKVVCILVHLIVYLTWHTPPSPFPECVVGEGVYSAHPAVAE